MQTSAETQPEPRKAITLREFYQMLGGPWLPSDGDETWAREIIEFTDKGTGQAVAAVKHRVGWHRADIVRARAIQRVPEMVQTLYALRHMLKLRAEASGGYTPDERQIIQTMQQIMVYVLEEPAVSRIKVVREFRREPHHVAR